MNRNLLILYGLGTFLISIVATFIWDNDKFFWCGLTACWILNAMGLATLKPERKEEKEDNCYKVEAGGL